ncbi:MAG: CsgG/HfaB family protein [Spirochaetales bacterium]|jgi:TolB-like protein|nr:CsgG/HfaB family protein [Spirochaetales bacterium]
MKNILLTVFTISLISCVSTANMDNMVSFDDAIRNASNNFVENIPAGSRVAILNFNSPSVRFSDFVTEELSTSLINRKSFVIVERKELDVVRKEMKFQLSGEVSDETAKSIGKMLGAEYVISGSFVDLRSFYRIRFVAVNVESSAREAASSFDISAQDTSINAFFEAPRPESQSTGINGRWVYFDEDNEAFMLEFNGENYIFSASDAWFTKEELESFLAGKNALDFDVVCLGTVTLTDKTIFLHYTGDDLENLKEGLDEGEGIYGFLEIELKYQKNGERLTVSGVKGFNESGTYTFVKR